MAWPGLPWRGLACYGHDRAREELRETTRNDLRIRAAEKMRGKLLCKPISKSLQTEARGTTHDRKPFPGKPLGGLGVLPGAGLIVGPIFQKMNKENR